MFRVGKSLDWDTKLSLSCWANTGLSRNSILFLEAWLNKPNWHHSRVKWYLSILPLGIVVRGESLVTIQRDTFLFSWGKIVMETKECYPVTWENLFHKHMQNVTQIQTLSPPFILVNFVCLYVTDGPSLKISLTFSILSFNAS